MKVTLLHLVFSALLPLFAAPASAAPWDVIDETSPLTGARTIGGSLLSSAELVNMIGAPERASLVLRCGAGSLSVYVNWPEVVNRDGENIFSQPKTIALWKIDEGAIQNNFWSISTTGTAAGEFGSKGAAKLLAALAPAHRLVVRLSGRITQDAVFDLGDITGLVSKVAIACNIRLNPTD